MILADEVDVFPAYLALWARSEPLALPGKFERKRGGKAMNRVKSRVLWARINPIQAFSLFCNLHFAKVWTTLMSQKPVLLSITIQNNKKALPSDGGDQVSL